MHCPAHNSDYFPKPQLKLEKDLNYTLPFERYKFPIKLRYIMFARTWKWVKGAVKEELGTHSDTITLGSFQPN